MRKPTAEEIRAAANGTVPDVIAPGLRVLFCGINPSLYTAAVGYHFARPGNRFWKALHAAELTERVLSPWETEALLAHGYGVTNVVERATATAAELSSEELLAGARRLEAKVAGYRPRILAVLGMGAYRTAFKRRQAGAGPQPETIAGAAVWVLPNPSGLNANYQLPALAELYGGLKAAADEVE